VEVDVDEVEVLVEVLVVLVEVDVEVEVVEVLVLVVEVESMMKVLVIIIAEPCESTTFPVKRTVPKAFWSNGTVNLIAFCVSILELIKEKIMFDVCVFVTRKL